MKIEDIDLSKFPMAFFDMNEEEMEDCIGDFLVKNTNSKGIDLSKLYVAELVKPEIPLEEFKYELHYGINCPVNYVNDPGILTIVFILKSQSEDDHIYVDLIYHSLLQSSFVDIDGYMGDQAVIRSGVTVIETYPLNEVLGRDRLPLKYIGIIFNALGELDIKVKNPRLYLSKDIDE